MTPKDLRALASDKSLDIGTAWNALEAAADRIEELERERLSICDVCWALQDSPRSFLEQMTAWTARVREEHKDATPAQAGKGEG